MHPSENIKKERSTRINKYKTRKPEYQISFHGFIEINLEF